MSKFKNELRKHKFTSNITYYLIILNYELQFSHSTKGLSNL